MFATIVNTTDILQALKQMKTQTNSVVERLVNSH